MKLELEVNNPQKLAMLLELLRSLDFVEKVRIADDSDISQVNEPTSFFNRFYGSAKTGMTKEEIDARLNEIRQEWERNI